jgi:hypothetical protein
MRRRTSSHSRPDRIGDARVRRLEQQQAQDEERLVLLTAVVERGFAGTLNSLEFMRALIERLINERTENVNLEQAQHRLSAFRDQVDRSRLELRVLSDSPAARRSSLQQLAALGDDSSHEFLRRLPGTGGLDGVENERLLATMDEIAQRTASQHRPAP